MPNRNLMTAQTGTTDGVWTRVQNLEHKVLQVEGIGTGTVQVYGYTPGAIDETPPTNSTDHEQIGSDITADGFTDISGNYTWMKLKKSDQGDTTATTGVITGNRVGY